MMRVEDRQRVPHIAQIPKNPVAGASDLVTADIHGGEVFFDVLRLRKNKGDRIFLAGDMVDRGPANVDIIRAITANNSDESNGKILAVRGNHEELCLNAMEALEILSLYKLGQFDSEDSLLVFYALRLRAEKNPWLHAALENPLIKQFINDSIATGEILCEVQLENSKATLDERLAFILENRNLEDAVVALESQIISVSDSLLLYKLNGGEWMIDLFLRETREGKIVFSVQGQIEYDEDSDILMIRNYLEQLPYIMLVEGDIPFVVVHAALPFSEELLRRKLAENKDLTDDEIDYATWSRPDDPRLPFINIDGIDNFSILIFVGHNIDRGVLYDCNTIDLDFMSFARGRAVVVNVTELKCLLTEAKGNNQDYDVSQFIELIQSQLNIQRDLYRMRYQSTKQVVTEVATVKTADAVLPIASQAGMFGLEGGKPDAQSGPSDEHKPKLN